MLAIMQSIKPRFIYSVSVGEKEIECRTTCPKDWKDYFSGKRKELPKPVKVLLYCTQDNNLELFMYEIEDKKQFTLFHKLDHQEEARIYNFNPQNMKGKVIGEYTLNMVYQYDIQDQRTWKDPLFAEMVLKKMRLRINELHEYVKDKIFYGWHIENLVIFDKPKDLGEFRICGEKKCIYGKCHKYMHCLKPLTRPFQSWGYIEYE